MDYERFFAETIAGLRAEGRYRVFADLERHAGRFPHATFRDENGTPSPVTVWCSNDYLGMGQHPTVIAAIDRKSTRLNSSHIPLSRMPSSA